MHEVTFRRTRYIAGPIAVIAILGAAAAGFVGSASGAPEPPPSAPGRTATPPAPATGRTATPPAPATGRTATPPPPNAPGNASSGNAASRTGSPAGGTAA